MNRRVVLIGAALLVALAGLGITVILRSGAPRLHGPLRQEVYVWQRVWTPPVREAVTHLATNFDQIVPLKAEISWNDKQPRLVRVALDYSALAKSSQQVGLALRVGPYAGPFTTNDLASRFVIETAEALVAEARTNSLSPSELQIDFDCAESKLGGYRVWVEAIQRRVSPVPVTITALPSWLNAREFRTLARVATNYVLQVHSVDRPRSVDAPFTLCDPLKARRAVERAGRIGLPFRVALPTYGYLLAFSHEGKYLGLSAEGPRPNWPTNAVVREVGANSQELAALVNDWTRSRPAALNGVIWYRLPTSQDRHNWDWAKLRSVMQATNANHGGQH